MPDRALDELRQVARDEPRVFPGEFHFAGKTEVVADKNCHPGGDASREGFVVTVLQPQDPAVILIGFRALDFHEAEVTGVVVAEAVGLGADDKAVGF